MEETLVILKPDSVKRNLIGEIIKRYEDEGLEIKNMKFIENCEELIKKHYPDDEDYIVSLGKKSMKGSGDSDIDPKKRGKEVILALREYMTSGPVIPIIFTGENAIKRVRKVTGYTDPSEADEGTIRGDLSNDSIEVSTEEKRAVRNLVHASGDPKEAKEEIDLWFGE